MKQVIGRHVDETKRYTMSVKAGLCKIGEQRPYFTITFDDSEGSGGAGHEQILEHFPEFADIVAMHLSDEEGTPLHAVENGWYWLKQANAGEAKAFEYFKSTLRQNEGVARAIVSWGNALIEKFGEPHAKQRFAGWCDIQRATWREEARVCIEKYKLEVFTTGESK